MTDFSPSSSADAVFRALGPDLQAALMEEARLLGVPLSRFPEFARVPALRRYEVVATLRVAETIRPTAKSGEDAFDRACVRLGLNPDTVRSQVKRAGRAARKSWPRSA